MLKIKKQKSLAFGRKDVYLLGVKHTGEKVWLEAASWDCGWYWGFGYIEIYQQNWSPEKARDIQYHSHWDNSIVGVHDIYDNENHCFKRSDYVSHINENKEFESTTVSDDESWELAELLESFYVLSRAAAVFKEGCAGITANKCGLKDSSVYNRINKILLPKIFSRVYEILSPAPAKEGVK